MGLAFVTTIEAGVGWTTLELKANFTRALTVGHRCRALHRLRRPSRPQGGDDRSTDRGRRGPALRPRDEHDPRALLALRLIPPARLGRSSSPRTALDRRAPPARRRTPRRLQCGETDRARQPRRRQASEALEHGLARARASIPAARPRTPAAVARESVSLPQRIAPRCGGRLEHPVTRLMAVAIVELLEVVEVDDPHTEASSETRRFRDRRANRRVPAGLGRPVSSSVRASTSSRSSRSARSMAVAASAGEQHHRLVARAPRSSTLWGQPTASTPTGTLSRRIGSKRAETMPCRPNHGPGEARRSRAPPRRRIASPRLKAHGTAPRLSTHQEVGSDRDPHLRAR